MLELICQQRYRVDGIPVDMTRYRNHGTGVGTLAAPGPSPDRSAASFPNVGSHVEIPLGPYGAWAPLQALKIEVDARVDPRAARTMTLVQGDGAFRFRIVETALEAGFAGPPAVSMNTDGTLRVQMPERRRPMDEITSAMGILHSIGFIRAIAGALDCLGASVVGVAALRANLLRADLDSARRALAAVGGANPGEALQTQFGAQLEALIERAGPPGWFRWVIDLRNTLIHRGRRLQMSELRPVPSGVVGFDGRPVIRTDVIHQLPRDPGRSDIEMFLDPSHSPVLTESAAMTLSGVLESTLRLIGEGGAMLVDVWRTRRANPALLPQPREQWPAGPSTASAGFEGYVPGSIPYNPSQLRSDATLVRRMMAASLGDAARGAWANFD